MKKASKVRKLEVPEPPLVSKNEFLVVWAMVLLCALLIMTLFLL
jgi:hypothetical protein